MQRSLISNSRPSDPLLDSLRVEAAKLVKEEDPKLDDTAILHTISTQVSQTSRHPNAYFAMLEASIQLGKDPKAEEKAEKTRLAAISPRCQTVKTDDRQNYATRHDLFVGYGQMAERHGNREYSSTWKRSEEY